MQDFTFKKIAEEPLQQSIKSDLLITIFRKAFKLYFD